MQPFKYLFVGFKAVLQANGAVEYQVAGPTVLAVGAEVAQTHELVGSGSLCVLQTLFHLTAGEHFQGVGIQTSQEVLACGIGIGIVEQIAVLPYLSLCTVVGIHPVDGCTLDLAAVSGITATGIGVIGCQYFDYLAVFRP